MANRNDPGSISFGRLLHQTAETVKRQEKEIESLKKTQQSPEEKLMGKELAAARRSERTRASQLLASYDATAEDLQGLNQSLLSRSQQEQLRHNLNSLKAAELSPLPAFTPEAQLRIQNWQSQAAINPHQQRDFAQANLPPEPETPFQKWDRRQKSLSGRKWNEQTRRAEYNRDEMAARFKYNQQAKSKSKENGRHIGGLKDLND